MSPEVSAAIIGFGAAILGGILQSTVSWFQAHKQFERDSRQRDYELFVEAVAEMSQAPANSDARKSATAKMIEGKAKILLNGSPEVVAALDKQSSHPVVAGEQAFEDFCALVEVMRDDVDARKFDQFKTHARSILFEDGSGVMP